MAVRIPPFYRLQGGAGQKRAGRDRTMNDYQRELSEAILSVLRVAGGPIPAAEVARRVIRDGSRPATEAEVRSFLRRLLAGRVVHAGGDEWILVPRDGPGAEPPEAPRCPRCGAPLEIRKWRKPPHAGRKFWGCSRYRERKCSYTRDLG